jgi:DNA-binding transcriptional LysR family regulator
MTNDLAKIDLNLLVLFDALAAEQSVTRAARRIGVTQPSASKGLDRLRHLFKDDLFVRTARGMRPTPRATELSGPVSHALTTVRDVVAHAQPFKAAEAKGVIRIAMSDAAEFVLLPQLVARLAQKAPGVDLRARPLDKDIAFEHLDAGKLDYIVGVFDELPKRYESLPLWEERFLCIANSGSLPPNGRMSLDLYANMPHILVSLRDDALGAVDEALAKTGRKRRIAATLGRFMVVPFVVHASNCVATMPSRMARAVAASTGCVVFDPPVPMKPWQETLIWHRANDRSPLLSWFRTIVRSCAPK